MGHDLQQAGHHPCLVANLVVVTRTEKDVLFLTPFVQENLVVQLRQPGQFIYPPEFILSTGNAEAHSLKRTNLDLFIIRCEKREAHINWSMVM